MLRKCLAIVEMATGKPGWVSRCLAPAAPWALILLYSSISAMSQAVALPAAPQAAGKPASHHPQVTCERGLLTIAAENSSLAEILDAVRLFCAGASIEFPPAASGERATVKLGPAPAAKVLADLLRGSPFDYLVVGSGQELNRLQVVLSEKTAPAEPPIPAALAAHLPHPAVVPETSENPTSLQNQLSEEKPLAMTGAFLGAPVDETVFTPPEAEIQSGTPARMVRPSKENPRYFQPLKKQ